MQNVKIEVVSLMKTKKGNLQLGYLLPKEETENKLGYDYFDAWFKPEEFDFLELKNYIGKTLTANFIYKDTYGGNAVRVIDCVFDANGVVIIGR